MVKFLIVIHLQAAHICEDSEAAHNRIHFYNESNEQGAKTLSPRYN